MLSIGANGGGRYGGRQRPLPASPTACRFPKAPINVTPIVAVTLVGLTARIKGKGNRRSRI